jgi:hypothetical protein
MVSASFRKLAEETAAKVCNSQEAAVADVDDNRSSTRSYLSGVLDNTGAFERSATSDLKRLLPGKGDKHGGNPFFKLAFPSFNDELQKIAITLGKPVGIPGRTLSQVTAGNANRAMSNGRIGGGITRIPDPSAGASSYVPGQLAPQVKAMRAASAARPPGILSRIFGGG